MDASGRLSLAGFCATTVTFGPARNGYGLFLPDIWKEFELAKQVLGLTASGLYAGYLATLLAVGPLAAATYGLPSRAAWLAFAAAFLAVAVLNAALLPHGFDGLRETESVGWPGLGWF